MMKSLRDVITPSDRRSFLKKVGFGVGATMLGPAALPAVLTRRLNAAERCTTTCTTPPPSIPPTSAQNAHNAAHVPL